MARENINKEKKIKKNDFILFDCTMKNIKYNKINYIFIFKLFNLHIKELKSIKYVWSNI